MEEPVSAQSGEAAAPPAAAVDGYMDSGRDETGFGDLDGILGARR